MHQAFSAPKRYRVHGTLNSPADPAKQLSRWPVKSTYREAGYRAAEEPHRQIGLVGTPPASWVRARFMTRTMYSHKVGGPGQEVQGKMSGIQPQPSPSCMKCSEAQCMVTRAWQFMTLA
jgi:hypothetical protein